MRTWRLASIPKEVRIGLAARLEKHAARKWKHECCSVVVRFRGVYAYVDAYPARQDYMPGLTKEQKATMDAKDS